MQHLAATARKHNAASHQAQLGCADGMLQTSIKPKAVKTETRSSPTATIYKGGQPPNPSSPERKKERGGSKGEKSTLNGGKMSVYVLV
jgi:hypothetical protein